MNFLIDFFDHISLMGIFISFSAYFLGIKFPDWDFKMGMRHRSLLTHTPLILLLFIRLYEESKNENFRYFLIGFSLALALHFIFDLYPHGWGGGALIKIPLTKLACTPKATRMLLYFSIGLSLVVSIAYTKNIYEFYYLLFLGVVTILRDAVKEGKLLRPLLSFFLLEITGGAIKHPQIYRGLIKIFKSVVEKIDMLF